MIAYMLPPMENPIEVEKGQRRGTVPVDWYAIFQYVKNRPNTWHLVGKHFDTSYTNKMKRFANIPGGRWEITERNRRPGETRRTDGDGHHSYIYVRYLSADYPIQTSEFTR